MASNEAQQAGIYRMQEVVKIVTAYLCVCSFVESHPLSNPERLSVRLYIFSGPDIPRRLQATKGFLLLS